MKWILSHASVMGTSHAKHHTPCQDFHLVEQADGALLMAVADGAGSARLADLGAQMACTLALQALISVDWPNQTMADTEMALWDAVIAARQGIASAAQDRQVDTRDLASTLLVAVATPRYTLFGQLGDGAALYDTGDGLKITYWTEQEALNLTDFLTETAMTSFMLTAIPKGAVRVALMTDGLTQLLLDFKQRTAHGPAMDRLFNACLDAPDPSLLNADLERFLNSPAVNARSDDDKTLVLAAQPPPAFNH